MKGLLRKISSKRINKLARFSRKVYFALFDLAGEGIFAILRLLKIVAPISSFKKDDIRNILIVRLDRLGDLLLSAPAIRAVREGFPKAQIHLLVKEYAKDLVIGSPNIDKLLIYEKDKVGHNYDLAITLHNALKLNYIVFRSGARYRLGYTGRGGGFFLTHKITDDRDIRVRHEVESNLEIVGIVGCVTKNKDTEVSITEEGEKFAERFFQENKINPADIVIMVHPGARQEYVRWAKEGFAAVADGLIKQKNVKIILSVSQHERQLAEEILSMMEEKPLLALGLELTQLVSLIKRCNLFIGNASGPVHIASALKIPVVAIFGVIHPLDGYPEWGPWGVGHIVVSKNLSCPDCHPSDCKSFDCMKLISASEVLAAAFKQLKIKP